MKRGNNLKAAIEAASLLPFSGVTYRVTNLRYFETLTGTDGGFRADNRFTRAGLTNALYVADAPDLALREATQGFQNEFLALEIPAHAVYPVHLRVSRVLDLTDIEVRDALNVSPMALTGDWRAALRFHAEDARNRIETHEIGEACLQLKLEGIRYQSAFDAMRHNFVLFTEHCAHPPRANLPEVVLRAQEKLKSKKKSKKK